MRVRKRRRRSGVRLYEGTGGSVVVGVCIAVVVMMVVVVMVVVVVVSGRLRVCLLFYFDVSRVVDALGPILVLIGDKQQQR